MKKVLDVYLYEKYVGKFRQDEHGQLIFKYDEAYAKDPKSAALSISLPLSTTEYSNKEVRPFFAGILPEASLRYRIARCIGISEKNDFSFLQALGGECAGAVSLYPEGQSPPPESKNDIEVLSHEKLLYVLDTIKQVPLLAGIDNLRISLAGAQDKLPVIAVDGEIALAHGSTPTTHILKPMITGFKDTVHNELFCLHLARMVGIETPNSEVYTVGKKDYFLIERYDRKKIGNKVIRLHQEDFCQALGIPPEKKYENEGGLSITECLRLIQSATETPIRDRKNFLKIVIFNYIIGNADAHGKNFSLLYKDNIPTLAPAYDLLCTEIYPDVSMKMAMKIGSKYDPYWVALRHWHRIVKDTKAAKEELEESIESLSETCLRNAYALNTELTASGRQSPIYAEIINCIETRTSHLQKALSERSTQNLPE